MPLHIAGLQSWLILISQLSPGKTNTDADGLSLMPLGMEEYMQKCLVEVSPDVISCVTKALSIQSKEHTPWMCPATIETR